MKYVLCPGCGNELLIVPGYSENGLVYEFAICDTKSCPVRSVRIEWRLP